MLIFTEYFGIPESNIPLGPPHLLSIITSTLFFLVMGQISDILSVSFVWFLSRFWELMVRPLLIQQSTTLKVYVRLARNHLNCHTQTTIKMYESKLWGSQFKLWDQAKWLNWDSKWCRLRLNATTNLFYFYFSVNLCCQITCMLMDNDNKNACTSPCTRNLK